MIIPGVGVGVLRLGERVDAVLEKVGPVDTQQWRIAQASKGEEMIWLSLENMGMSLAFDFRTRKLKKILVLTEALLVQKTGIRVGSSENQVIRYFENQSRIKQMRPPSKDLRRESRMREKERKIIPVLDYPSLGIKFYLDPEDRTVHSIEVYERPSIK